jgi:hypothetical protein
MRISARHQKILGSVPRRKSIREGCSERALFWVCPLPKNFQHNPSCDFFASAIGIEKLLKTEGLILVKLRGHRFRIHRVVAPFRCLSFITEFVEDSFDAAPGFSVLKNEPGGLSDFPGHFSGSREDGRLVFAWFWGPGSSGRVVWGDKTKTRHFSDSLGCVGRQHPQLRHNCATCSYCGCKTAVFSIFAFLDDFATYRLVLQKMAIFCVSHKIYIADRAFFDLIFHFGISPPK